MSLIRRISLSKRNGVQVGLASTYVGSVDDIWADDVDFNLLRRGDGTTPGGIVMGGGSGGGTAYTAGEGLSLTGTVFSLTDTHFSGDYADLTNTPTLTGSITNYGIITDSVLEVSNYGTITEASGTNSTPISLSTLKSITAASTSFADFQSRISAL